MNWYFLYKIASVWRNDNDVLASQMADKILSVVKGTIGHNMMFSLPVDKKCMLFIIINYIDKKLRYDTFQIIGGTHISKTKSYDPFIRLDIELGLGFTQDYFSGFYYILLDAIRNELEHYNRYIKNMPSEDSLLTTYPDNYMESCYLLKDELLSDNEMEPYIRGLFLVAKKQHVSFEKKLDESLYELFFRGNSQFKDSIINSEIGPKINTILIDIKNAIMGRTKKIFPWYNYD